jgi:hypothetical protein
LPDQLSAVGPGHLDGERLDLVGVGADPAEIDRLVEQVEPAFKVPAGERSLRMDQLVGPERIAGIARKAEQEPTPEVGQLRQMLRPVDPRHLVEQRPEEVVLGHVAIETTDHLGDLTWVAEIAGRGPVSALLAHMTPFPARPT